MLLRKQQPVQQQQPAKQITSLPPDLVARVFALLPVKDLATVACVSRRFKVLAYSDAVYEPKLRMLEIASFLSPTGESTDSSELLATKLKQLPGGQFLPGTSKYLETGSMFSAPMTGVSESENRDTLPAIPAVNTDPPKQTQQIVAALPDMRTSNLIIGAGGLKAALAKAKAEQTDSKKKVKKTLGLGHLRLSPGLVMKGSHRTAREEFRNVYIHLAPYYFDFRGKSKESKLFKDYKDWIEIGAMLYRLKLFDDARFVDEKDEICFSLETTVEWFESMVIGSFERAYDRHDLEEMRKCASASYQLNGGMACVNVFISKNPVFFDSTYNPSLVASKLPTMMGPSVGYALADEFAKVCTSFSHIKEPIS